MLRINFNRELTALELRDPIIKACKVVATEHDLYARFVQRQQPAFTRSDDLRKKIRIGNGQHKDWSVHFQTEPLSSSRPTISGIIVIRSLIDPEFKQYGGFDYGTSSHYPEETEAKPSYEYIDLLSPSEHGWTFNRPDLSEDLQSLSYLAIERSFNGVTDRLF